NKNELPKRRRRHMLIRYTLLACTLVLGCVSALAAEGPDSWTRKRIIPKTADVWLYDFDAKGKGTPLRKVNAIEYTVRQDSQNWLLIFDMNREGWIKKAEAVLIQDAVAYFSEQIKANPQSASAWMARGSAWDANGEFDKAIKDY